MGICRKPKTTRWSEEEIADIEMLNEKYAPFTNGFSSVLRLALKVLKAFTLTPDKVIEYLEERQQIQGMTSYDTRQLLIQFPRAVSGCEFFPRITHPFHKGGQQ